MNLFVIHLLSVLISVVEGVNDPYTRMRVPNNVKNINVKVVNPNVRSKSNKVFSSAGIVLV